MRLQRFRWILYKGNILGCEATVLSLLFVQGKYSGVWGYSGFVAICTRKIFSGVRLQWFRCYLYKGNVLGCEATVVSLLFVQGKYSRMWGYRGLVEFCTRKIFWDVRLQWFRCYLYKGNVLGCEATVVSFHFVQGKYSGIFVFTQIRFFSIAMMCSTCSYNQSSLYRDITSKKNFLKCAAKI